MAKAYLITNPTGNTCGVSKKRYEKLIDREGYSGEIIDKSYPIDKGAGWYELSNGESVRGKEQAEQKQAEL